MRSKLLLFILFLCGLKLSAQQLPQYTQYTFNEQLINPAVTGIESYWDAKAGNRAQWTGLAGAPKTTYFTISIPFDEDFTLNDYAQMLRNSDNPLGRTNADDYRASAEHSGLGFSVISDKAAQISQTHVNLSYAYHIRISDVTNLSVGASFGIKGISLNTSQVTLVNPVDAAIQNSTNQWKPDAGIGVWYYGARFFIGASAQQLLPSTITFSNDLTYTEGKTYPQYFLTAGYRLFLSDDVTALPSVVFKPFDKATGLTTVDGTGQTTTSHPLSYDLNMKIAFRDNFWVGGAFRKNDAVAASFGFNLGAFMTLGYSYDYTTSQLNSVSYGTHEIMLGVFLKNNYNTTSARHTW